MSRRAAFLPLFLLMAMLLAGRIAAADPTRYRIQPEASEARFRATSRLMDADGKFSRLAGEVTVDPKDPATAKISVTIDAVSIDTGIGMRDKHLRSADFLDVARFPTIKFESQHVELTGKKAAVTGQLTVHGVTREIVVPVEVQLSDVALIATGEFVLNRRDYAINYSSVLNPIGDSVRITFTFRARAS
ncbi:MAG TPA: YceI family protein [Methylomirabilota bacterium]